MVRLRAVPSAVWTAVGALAFLASTGLVLVLSAGLHVWSAPVARVAEAAGHVLRGAGSGVVTIPGAARLVHPATPGPSSPGPSSAGTPSAPVAVPAPPAAVPAATNPAGATPAPPVTAVGQPTHQVSTLLVRPGGGLRALVRGLAHLNLVRDLAIVPATTDGTVPAATGARAQHGHGLKPQRDRRHGHVAGGAGTNRQHPRRHAAKVRGDVHGAGRHHHNNAAHADGTDGHKHGRHGHAVGHAAGCAACRGHGHRGADRHRGGRGQRHDDALQGQLQPGDAHRSHGRH